VIESLQRIWQQDFSATRWDFKDILGQGNLGLTTSPESRTRLVALLKSATKSLWIQNQYLEDPVINDMIMEKAKEGLDVHVQIAAFCTFGEPSDQKKEKINKIFTEFDAAGVKTKIFTSKIKINDKKGYMHAKAIIVDEKTGWIGSINGSETSTTQNREFGIIFSHKNSVKKLIQVMSDDFSHPLATSWRDSLNCSK
jgi:hypothetical protein